MPTTTKTKTTMVETEGDGSTPPRRPRPRRRRRRRGRGGAAASAVVAGISAAIAAAGSSSAASSPVAAFLCAHHPERRRSHHHHHHLAPSASIIGGATMITTGRGRRRARVADAGAPRSSSLSVLLPTGGLSAGAAGVPRLRPRLRLASRSGDGGWDDRADDDGTTRATTPPVGVGIAGTAAAVPQQGGGVDATNGDADDDPHPPPPPLGDGGGGIDVTLDDADVTSTSSNGQLFDRNERPASSGHDADEKSSPSPSPVESVSQLPQTQLTSSSSDAADHANDAPPAPFVDDDKDDSGMSLESVSYLNLVAVIWGTQHAVIKMVVGDDPHIGGGVGGGGVDDDAATAAAAFTLARFAVGAALAAPFLPPVGPAWDALFVGGDGGGEGRTGEVVRGGEEGVEMEEEDAPGVAAWRWGAEMGTWMFLGYAFQAVGLQYTTASRSGFLLYLNVKFVPFLARIFLGRSISVPTWISAATALVGTALLSSASSPATSSAAAVGAASGLTASGSFSWLVGALNLNVGDAWSVAAAVASAAFILRLEEASVGVEDGDDGGGGGASALNAASLVVVTAWAACWTAAASLRHELSLSSSSTASFAVDSAAATVSTALRSAAWSVWDVVASHPLELIYLGGVTTALANYMQARGQRGVSAERASVIYAMDPVWGACFANLLLGETLGGSTGALGAALITLAAATNAFLDLGGGGNGGGGDAIGGGGDEGEDSDAIGVEE